MSQQTDRGVSVAVTHVLALGITAVLIGVLFTGTGSLVEFQTDRSAEHSLETIGERLAGQIEATERLDAEIRAEHPSDVSGMSYTITFHDDCTNDPEPPLIEHVDNCIQLTASGADVDVYVPVRTELDGEASVRGGTVIIEWDDDELEATLSEAS